MLIFINKQRNHILNANNRTNFRNVNRKTVFFTEHLRWILLDARPKLDVYDIHVISWFLSMSWLHSAPLGTIKFIKNYKKFHDQAKHK